MGTRYICDICGKEYDVKGAFTDSQIPGTGSGKWAIISYLAPKESEPPQKSGSAMATRPAAVYAGIGVGIMPESFLVCSQACAEKALDEVRERLRLAFEKLAE